MEDEAVKVRGRQQQETNVEQRAAVETQPGRLLNDKEPKGPSLRLRDATCHIYI